MNRGVGFAFIALGVLLLGVLNVYQYRSIKALKEKAKQQVMVVHKTEKKVVTHYAPKQAEVKKVKPVPVPPPPIETKIYVVKVKEVVKQNIKIVREEVCKPKVEVVKEYIERPAPPPKEVVVYRDVPRYVPRYIPMPAPVVYYGRPYPGAYYAPYPRYQRKVVRVDREYRYKSYRERPYDRHQLANRDRRQY